MDLEEEKNLKIKKNKKEFIACACEPVLYPVYSWLKCYGNGGNVYAKYV